MAIQGPKLDAFQATARECVMIHFATIAEQLTRRPAMQRAMDSVKKAEAQGVLDGVPSPNLEIEALDRGQTVEELARDVLRESDKVWELERARVRLSLAIDATTTHGQVLKILRDAGVAFTERPFR